MSQQEKARLQVIISGQVQGVFFRAKTKETAQELDLSGWVKNLPDGQVEAIFEGEKFALKKILQYLKTGPRLAQVTNLKTSWQKYQDEFKEFEIRY